MSLRRQRTCYYLCRHFQIGDTCVCIPRGLTPIGQHDVFGHAGLLDHDQVCLPTDCCTPAEWPHSPSITPNAGKQMLDRAPQLSELKTRGFGWLAADSVLFWAPKLRRSESPPAVWMIPSCRRVHRPTRRRNARYLQRCVLRRDTAEVTPGPELARGCPSAVSSRSR
jgi:hypothetical protein